MVDVMTREQRSRCMSRIRSKNTKPERDFQQKHPDATVHPDWLLYRPDFLLHGKAVFLDSAFWHGEVPKRTYDKMSKYWQEKLFRNVVRDVIASSFYETVGGLKRISINHT